MATSHHLQDDLYPLSFITAPSNGTEIPRFALPLSHYPEWNHVQASGMNTGLKIQTQLGNEWANYQPHHPPPQAPSSYQTSQGSSNPSVYSPISEPESTGGFVDWNVPYTPDSSTVPAWTFPSSNHQVQPPPPPPPPQQPKGVFLAHHVDPHHAKPPLGQDHSAALLLSRIPMTWDTLPASSIDDTATVQAPPDYPMLQQPHQTDFDAQDLACQNFPSIARLFGSFNPTNTLSQGALDMSHVARMRQGLGGPHGIGVLQAPKRRSLPEPAPIGKPDTHDQVLLQKLSNSVIQTRPSIPSGDSSIAQVSSIKRSIHV